MKTKEMLKEAARWLLGSKARVSGCSVEGCNEKYTLAVAGDDSGTTFMCVHHAIAWSESSQCQDIAQNNSGASQIAMTSWISASHTTA